MKKSVFCLIAACMVLSLVFTQAPRTVSADGVGEGSWVLPGAPSGTTYTTVDVEKAAENAPSWVRLFSEGIKISSPTKICYSFRRAAFHWVPKIMQLKKGSWVNITSTVEYLTGNEGGAYACAEPSEAGTFALFAYYNGPKESISQPGKSFTVGSWLLSVNTEQEPPSQDFGFLYANDVNWSGYPEATQLGWGIHLCLDESCHDTSEDSTSISELANPYPQNMDITLIDSMSWSFAGIGGGTSCEFRPFVVLLDKDDNELAKIYFDSEYIDRCVS